MVDRNEKRLHAMRARPNADWTIADVEAVCRPPGIVCAAARGGSSHYKIAHPSQAAILTVPFRRPIKPICSASSSLS